MIAEADVALTDYALALLCAWCAARTAHGPARRVRPWATLLLVSVGLGALIGGTAHGFAPDHAGPAFRWLWSATMLCLGGAGLALAGLAAAIALTPRGERMAVVGVALLLIPYAVLVVVFRAPFWWALAAYLPALVAFLGALLIDSLRRRDATHAAGIASVLITVFAALLQSRLIASAPLNHNVAYHLLQMVAMLLIPLWTHCEARFHAQPT